MILRRLCDAEKNGRKIVSKTWDSTRLILKNDNMGFSFHITTIYANTETPLWYKNHLESVYCISGEGEVETCDDGKVYKIEPGTVYVLDKNDKHLLRAKTELKLACVFNPPLNGKEVHDKDGAYSLEAEEISTDD
mgnify:FL=1